MNTAIVSPSIDRSIGCYLAGARLAVSKDAAVVAIEAVVGDGPGDRVEDLLLRAVLVGDVVEIVLALTDRDTIVWMYDEAA